MISSVENIIGGNCRIVNISIIQDLDLYGMINCDFIILKNFNHCIKESITLYSIWLCSLDSIHAFKTKYTIISIERNIGLRYLKPV